MAMAAGSSGGVKASPNVTPMIDVMLVLLIIFMIVIPAINAGFAAEPPKGVNLKARPEDNEEIVLGIDKDGKYYLDKRPIKNETLFDQLKEKYDKRTVDKILFIKAHNELKYVKVLEALDIAGKAGVRMTGMISEQRPGTISAVPGDNPLVDKAKGVATP